MDASKLADRSAMEAEAIEDAKAVEQFGGGRKGRRALQAQKFRKARRARRARARAQKGTQARDGAIIQVDAITIAGDPDRDAPNCGHGRPFPAMCPWCNGTNGSAAPEQTD